MRVSKTIGILITIFLGGLGVHRFCAKHIGTGILWLCTAGIFGLGWIFDIFKVCTGTFTTKDGYIWAV
jgi:TM2 domain-containing membrane protein YozV